MTKLVDFDLFAAIDVEDFEEGDGISDLQTEHAENDLDVVLVHGMKFIQGYRAVVIPCRFPQRASSDNWSVFAWRSIS